MSDIQLNLSDSNTLAFDVEVDGANMDDMKASFIIEADGMSYSFAAKILDGEIEVELPPMKSKLKANEYNCKLAFVVEGDKYFEPMKAVIDFINPVTVKATTKVTNKTKTTKKLKESQTPVIRVRTKKSIKDLIIENLDVLAASKTMTSLQTTYVELVNEGKTIDKDDMLLKLDVFCEAEHSKSFKDYVKGISK